MNRRSELSTRLAWLALLLFAAATAAAQTVFTNFAGSTAGAGSFDGTGTLARFSNPCGIALDAKGILYIADRDNHTIRTITPDGRVATLAGLAGAAGSEDGRGGAARFDRPVALAVAADGTVYVADSGNATIRRISISRDVTTLAGHPGVRGSRDGAAREALFVSPAAIALDRNGNLYVADSQDHTIRVITPQGDVSTLAGVSGSSGSRDGIGAGARFNAPSGIAVDGAGNLYVADRGNSTVRRIGRDGAVTTVAGEPGAPGIVDGTGTAARFVRPTGIVADAAGSLYVSDSGVPSIRRIDPRGEVVTIARGAANAPESEGEPSVILTPATLALDSSGNLFVADSGNHAIQRVSATGVVSAVAGPDTSAGSSRDAGERPPAEWSGIAVDAATGNIVVWDEAGRNVRAISPDGVTHYDLSDASALPFPHRPPGSRASATDAEGNVYAADAAAHCIRKITPEGMEVILAGLPGQPGSSDGRGAEARFSRPSAVATGADGAVYVADTGNHTIRRVTQDGVVTTIGGNAGMIGNVDGNSRAARFDTPTGIAADAAGRIFVADRANRAIRVGTRALPIVATIDRPDGPVGMPRQLDASAESAQSWEWRITRRPAGSTAELSSATLRNPSFTPDVDDLYEFQLTARGPAGVAITSVTLLSVVVGTATVSGSTSICAGQSATLSVALTGAQPWSITWSDGTIQSGITTSPATRSVTPSTTTTYSLTSVSDAHGAGTVSGSATVTLRTVVTATLTNPVICAGTSAGISVALTGTPPWSIAWSDGVTQSGINSSPATRSVSPSATTTYTIASVSDAYCTTSTPDVSSTVKVIPASPSIAVKKYVCAGSTDNGASVDDAGPGAVYTWGITNGTITSGAGTAVITFSSSGSSSVGLTVAITNGSCSVNGSATIPTQDCTGVSPLYTFTRLAGPDGGAGYFDGNGTAARFNRPSGVALDAAGNLYVTDYFNLTVRKISAAGEVTTLAGLAGNKGTTDGSGGAARFRSPNGIALDASGNVYVSDSYNSAIRKITPGGTVSTFAGAVGVPGWADGTGTAATFNFPQGLAIDRNGNVYVADTYSQTIRKITPAGVVSTVYGAFNQPGTLDATGTAARFYNPSGLAFDSSGNLFVSDYSSHTIRKITPAGAVTTFAGLAGTSGTTDATGTAARFNHPWGLAIDGNDNLYVADYDNHAIRKVTAGAVVTTLAGLPGSSGYLDATGTAARFYNPLGVAVDAGGNVYAVDLLNAVRKITPGGVVSTFAGLPAPSGTSDGTGSAARFYGPQGVAIDAAGNIWIADSRNHTIRKLTAGGVVTTPLGVAGSNGSADGNGTAARFDSPLGLTRDSAGNIIVADAGNYRIRRVTPSLDVTTIAGSSWGMVDGVGTSARFSAPTDVAQDAAGNLLVTDYNVHTIRKITPASYVTTFAGLATNSGSTDATGSAARFKFPTALATDRSGNAYVADTQNHTIRKVTSDAAVTTLAGTAGSSGSTDGTGAAARFNSPNGIACDSRGTIYVADGANRTIRKVTSAGSVTTLAGSAGYGGNVDGTGTVARLNISNASGIASDGAGTLYVADDWGECVWVGRPAIPDRATIDAATGYTGIVRQLDASPQNATSWSWRVIRRPAGSTAQLSSTTVRNPTFTPDVADRYEFVVTASNSIGTSITSVALDVAAGSFGAPASITATALTSSSVDVSWPAVSGAVSYEVERSSFGAAFANVATVTGTQLTDSGLSANTTYVYRVRAVDGSATRSSFSPPDLATTILFTDDPVVAQSTVVKALHVTELRTAVNAVRAAAGLGSFTFTGTAAVGGPIIALNMTELRTALDAARSIIGVSPVGYSETPASGITVKAAHVNELRSGCK